MFQKILVKKLSYKVTSFYIPTSEKSVSESYMNNCFYLNPVYVFKKRRFCAQENSKPSVFAELEIAREYRSREAKKKRSKNQL